MAQSLSRAIKEDDEYATFRRIFKRATKNLDFDAIRKEAETLHSTRASRNLYGKNKLNPDKIAEADAQDMSWRSRLSEMRAKLYVNLSEVEEAIEAFNNYVMVTYGQDLKDDGFTTKDQRLSFLKNLLYKYHSYMKQGQGVIDLIDFFIKDIDASGYRIRDLVELVKLHHGDKRRAI